MDWDEDGDQDLLVGEADGHIHYYENVPAGNNPDLHDQGHLLANEMELDVGTLAIPVVHDWDEDGAKDLIVGSRESAVFVYLNVGSNNTPLFNDHFTLRTEPALTQIDVAPDVGDLNGDGLKDLVFGWWLGTLIYYPNSGTNTEPVFNGDHQLTNLGSILDPGGWTHPELNDWDEDGDLDLLVGQWTGEIYLYLNYLEQLQVTATPLDSPLVIPAAGGSFNFIGEVHNLTDTTLYAYLWTVVKAVSGFESEPLLLGESTLPPGELLSRQKEQVVPDTVPAGAYEYILRLGIYPDEIWAESGFSFTKLGVTAASRYVAGEGEQNSGGWGNTGAPFSSEVEENRHSSFVIRHLVISPNPFNAATVLSFELQNAGYVKLEVFDVKGRLVGSGQARPLRGEMMTAGLHQITFEASGLPSGLYFARLSGAGFSQVQKMVLVR